MSRRERVQALIDSSYAPTILGVADDQVGAAAGAAAGTAVEASLVHALSTPLTDDFDGTGIRLQSTLLSVTGIMVLPDAFFHGQVSATVVISRPDIAVVTATVYLRKEGNRYIIANYVHETGPATTSA